MTTSSAVQLPNHVQVLGQATFSQERELQADVARIEYIPDQWHYSDAEEQEVIDLISKRARAGVTRGRNTYLDLLFSQLAARTTTVGPLGEVTSYYSLILNHFDRNQEIRTLRDKYSTIFVPQPARSCASRTWSS
jgi:hypothetical protein